MRPLSGLKARAADALYEAGVVRFSERGFLLKMHKEDPNAPLSPYYVDARRLRSYVGQRKQAALILQFMIEEAMTAGLGNFELLADIPQAITPVVTTLSDLTGIPFVSPRGEKEYGSGDQIEGVFKLNQEVALCDDVISTAKSKLDAAGILKASGLIVEDVFILVDREQGGREQLEAAGYRLHAAFKQSELFEYGLRVGHIDQVNYDRAMEYPMVLAEYKRQRQAVAEASHLTSTNA